MTAKPKTMLKHEENPETAPQPAAQVRVTPEELVAALSRIEARKDANERQTDGTIPLGDAVQELGLNTTPEELLREIEAGRAHQHESPALTRRARTLRMSGVFGLALLMFGGMVAFLRSVPSQPAADSPAVAITLPPPQAVPKPISLDPNLMVQDAAGKLIMLSEVGDNQPVVCFYDNDNSSFQSFSPEDNSAREDWTLIKHGGKIYVRGWIDPMSAQALQKNGANIGTWESNYNDTEASHFSHIRITLPLNGFQIGTGGDIDKEFHAVNIHLDKHAYEKWQP